MYRVTKFPLLVVHCSLFSTPKVKVPWNFLSIRILLSCFYLLIFYFEKFSTESDVCRLPGYVKLNSLFRLKPVVE